VGRNVASTSLAGATVHCQSATSLVEPPLRLDQRRAADRTPGGETFEEEVVDNQVSLEVCSEELINCGSMDLKSFFH
jgi:hypothetical protein